jgi:hypothetical protein
MMFFVVGTIYVQVYLTGEGLSTAQVVSTGRPTVMLWWHKVRSIFLMSLICAYRH